MPGSRQLTAYGCVLLLQKGIITRGVASNGIDVRIISYPLKPFTLLFMEFDIKYRIMFPL